MPQIRLVSNQHDDDILIGVIAKLFQPAFDVLVCDMLKRMKFSRTKCLVNALITSLHSASLQGKVLVRAQTDMHITVRPTENFITATRKWVDTAIECAQIYPTKLMHLLHLLSDSDRRTVID